MKTIPAKNKYRILLYALLTVVFLSACSSGDLDDQSPPPVSDTQAAPFADLETKPIEGSESTTKPDSPAPEVIDEIEDVSEVKIKIIVGDQTLTATLEDNVTSQALIERLPFTLPMMDLYSREVVYRFEDPLPAEEVQTRGYTCCWIGRP